MATEPASLLQQAIRLQTYVVIVIDFLEPFTQTTPEPLTARDGGRVACRGPYRSGDNRILTEPTCGLERKGRWVLHEANIVQDATFLLRHFFDSDVHSLLRRESPQEGQVLPRLFVEGVEIRGEAMMNGALPL